jgi:MFS family permease
MKQPDAYLGAVRFVTPPIEVMGPGGGALITEASSERERTAGFRDVLVVGEFRILWVAYAQSRFGDQLARLAIAVLVFSRTSSALLTSLTYALSFLPPLVSAPLLSGLADRYPRRSVLVTTDLCRACLVGLMVIPAVPLAGIAVLLVLAVSLQPLYGAARNAMLPNVLEGERYVVGLGLVNLTDSIMQIAGFAFGGLLLELLGSRTALGIDVVTFALSALLVRLGTRAHRPVHQQAEPGPAPAPSPRGSILGGAALVWRDARLRNLALLVWLYGFYVAPEGIAAPYAQQLGGGAAAVGLLMAADPIGGGIGAVVLSRWLRPATRARLLGPLAVLSGVPLVLSALHPSLPSVIALWAVTGGLSTYIVLAVAEFTPAVPDHRRGQASGLLGAGLQASQGLGILLAGALVGPVAPSSSVALCGAAGALCAMLAGRAWRRAIGPRTRQAGPEAG